ncbi:MarC family protein [Limibacillus halophilus]|jgi:multiple antibiotic resistance protein
MIETLVAAFITFFVVLDPIGNAPIFAGLTPDASGAERRRLAFKGVLIGTGILLVFGLVGQALFEALGISLSAFRIAGGVLLLLLSIDMVMARQSGLRSMTPGEDEESGHRQDISVFPLAIPLIAGPGSLTSVVLLVGKESGDLQMQAAILGVMLLVLLTLLISLLLAAQIMKLLGVTGINVISRVAGVILAALAVQFIITGVTTLYPPA